VGRILTASRPSNPALAICRGIRLSGPHGTASQVTAAAVPAADARLHPPG